MQQKPQFPEVLEETKLHDLVGERSTILFNRLRCAVEDIQCLKQVVEPNPNREPVKTAFFR